MYCDLHVHSTFSDGTLTPRQLLQLACDAGLSAVALTEHNTVTGLPDFLENAKDFSVQAIPGIEFSVDYLDTELHLLALFVKSAYFDAITAMMEDFKRRKEQSNRDLVENLNQLGFVLDYEAIERRGSGYVNRAHIAAEMTEKGYTPSIKEAFKEYLNPKKGYYTPPRWPDVFEMIRFIKSMGAVAVLAHPFLQMDEMQLREFLPQAVEAGLDGMEALYPTYDDVQTACAQALCEEFDLLPSGGSDFHGDNKPHIKIGVGEGNLAIPEKFVKSLEKRAYNP